MKPHQVYRNLHNGKWSVQSRTGSTAKLYCHADDAVMLDCVFVVQPAGVLRVRENKRKFVHAFVRGMYAGPSNQSMEMSVLTGKSKVTDWVKVLYNPYKFLTFVRADNMKPVSSASVVIMQKDGTAMAFKPS